MSEALHPEYGPCDGFGPARSCAQCTRLVERDDGTIANLFGQVLFVPASLLAERDAEIARLKSPPAAPEPTLPGARYNKAMAETGARVAAEAAARFQVPADDRVLRALDGILAAQHRQLDALDKIQRALEKPPVARPAVSESLLSATRRDCGCSPQLSVGCAVDGCPRRTVQS